MQNKIITQITYKLKRQTKKSYTFVYLVIFMKWIRIAFIQKR